MGRRLSTKKHLFREINGGAITFRKAEKGGSSERLARNSPSIEATGSSPAAISRLLQKKKKRRKRGGKRRGGERASGRSGERGRIVKKSRSERLAVKKQLQK